MRPNQLAAFFETLTGVSITDILNKMAKFSRFGKTEKQIRHFRKYTRMYQRGTR